MSAPQQSGPNLSFAGLILLALLGTFVWKNAPLDSARPSDGSQEWLDLPRDRALPAKLWQDPFEPILSSDEFDHLMGDRSQFTSVPPCAIHKEGQQTGIAYYDLDSKSQALRVIMPMLTQGQDPEKIERRRRRRYGVVAALSEAGYVPRSPDEIQVCYFVKGEREGERGPWNSSVFVAPYEWYTAEDKTSDMPPLLVLWLNETAFSSDPFGKFSHLANQIAGNCNEAVPNGCRRNTSMFVLGPARSGTLIKMAAAASRIGSNTSIKKNFAKANIDNFHILSPAATVADSEVNLHLYPGTLKSERGDFAKLRAGFKPSNCEPIAFPGKADPIPCASFLRTIRTDDTIVASLVNELKLRVHEWDNDHDYIALISERDTSFGRALPKSFSRSLCPEKNGDCDNIRQFGYFRGIDGFIPGKRGTQSLQKTATGKDDSQSPLSSNDSAIRPPSGTGQLDYLRRLAADMSAWDTELRRSNQGRIRAIGILGSDVYDKLLILRALKDGFSNTIFFTTDLDAQLLHPSESRWTRNLLVSSSFGLSLNKDLQGMTPPFRDSYQTSIFLSTLLATRYNYPDCSTPAGAAAIRLDCSNQKAFFSHLPVQLFEIGRFGAVPMPAIMPSEKAGTTEHSSVSPAPKQRHFRHTWLKLGTLAVLLIFVVHQLRPAAGKVIFGLSLSAAGLFALLGIAMYDHDKGEPLLFSQGTSVWPTELLRFISSCLAIYFIVRLSSDLGKNVDRLNRDYFGAENTGLTNHDKTIRDLLKNSCGDILNCLKRNSWIWAGFIPLGLVISGMLLTTKYHITNPVAVGSYWVTALAIWYMVLYPFAHVKSINAWAKQNIDLSEKTSWAKSYWDSYCELGTIRDRIYRSLTLWLLFMSFAAITFILTGVPDAPTRGETSFKVDKALIVFSVSSMLILIFMVLDEFRMCNYWIQGFIRRKFDWQNINIKRYGDDLKLSVDIPNIEWFKIRLIADRTDVIGQLIYYPSLVIIVMLLSRHSYFDNWGMPPGIAVVISMNILLLFMSAIKLRRQAEACRKQAIDTLKLEAQGLDADQAKPINTIISEIRAINDGAFLPIREQPLVRASLPLLGAIGLTVGEYMRMLN